MSNHWRRAPGWAVLLLPLLLAAACWLPPQPAEASSLPALAGRIIDFQGQPVDRAYVVMYINGAAQPYAEGESQEDGAFILDLPATGVDRVRLEISHPHFQSTTWEADGQDLESLRDGWAVRPPDVVLERTLTIGFWLATITFVGILVLIATERLHSTMAALLGIAIILGVSVVGRPLNEGLFILDFERAISYVDFNVIFLVMGMMIVVGIIEETGIFQWVAYQSYRLSRGRAWLLVIILMLITSVASAFLDNVTTMLLMAPITLQIALIMGMDPLALLIPEMLASNVGGISTLIGTPTNILIGSYANISFNDFLGNLTIGVLLAQVVLSGYVLLYFRKDYRSGSSKPSLALLQRLEENARITQPAKLRKAGIVFIGILALFVFGEQIHLIPAVTAILGAVAMLLVVQADVQEMLRVVDWTTLMFFISLFIIVGAIQEVGLISYIAAGIHTLVGENLLLAGLVTMWAVSYTHLTLPTN